MKNIGFSEEEINSVIDIVVAILLLGNVEFETFSKPGVGDVSRIEQGCEALVEQICKLVCLEKDAFKKALTVKTSTIMKDVIETPLSKEEAYSARDAMAKQVYGKLFSWLV